jgi:CubicO group peptidase (beta-lactamase class C family)
MNVALLLPLALLSLLPAGAAQSPAAPPPTSATSARSAATSLQDLADLLAPIREQHRVPALGVAVLVDGELAGLGVTGVRRVGHDEKVTADDLWHLGSCTKAMTATLCGVLAEEGALPLDATIGQVFPDEVAGMAKGWADVRLEWLLRNRSGAPAALDQDGLWGRLWTHAGTPVEMRRDLLRGVVRRPPVHAPGTTFLYSNAGFAIAGAMAETKAGKPWEDLLRERLFTPLGITTAGYGAPGRAGATEEPWGHRPDGTAVEPGPGSDNPAAIGPAGTVHMSITDWAKFAALHLEAARGKPRLLRKETFARLHEPPSDGDYAMGWARPVRDWAGGRVLTHGGSNTMWFCVVWIAPERDLAVLVCANRGGDAAVKAVDEVAWALVEAEVAASRGR